MGEDEDDVDEEKQCFVDRRSEMNRDGVTNPMMRSNNADRATGAGSSSVHREKREEDNQGTGEGRMVY